MLSVLLEGWTHSVLERERARGEDSAAEGFLTDLMCALPGNSVPMNQE